MQEKSQYSPQNKENPGLNYKNIANLPDEIVFVPRLEE